MAVSHRSKHWGFVVVCVPWSVKNEPATIIGLYCLSNRDRLIQFQLIYWLLTMCPSINPSFNFVLKTAYLLKACYILGTFLGSGEQSRKGLSSQGVHILVGRKTVNKIWTNKEYQRVVRKEEGKKKKGRGNKWRWSEMAFLRSDTQPHLWEAGTGLLCTGFLKEFSVWWERHTRKSNTF